MPRTPMISSLRAFLTALLVFGGLLAGYVPLNGLYYPWYNEVAYSNRSGYAYAVKAGELVAFILVVLVVLWWWRRRRNLPLNRDSTDWIVAAIPAWLLLCGIILHVSLPFLALGIFPNLFSALIYFLGRGTRLELRHVAAVVILAATALAISVLLDAEGWMHRAPQRPGGLLGSRNFAGEYLALAVPSLLVLWSRVAGEKFWHRTLHAGFASAALLVGAALVLTRSRTSWIATIVGVMVVIALARGAWRRVMIPLTAIVLGAIIGGNMPTRLKWKEEHPLRASAARLIDFSSGSGAFRRDQYREAASIALKHPLLGVGPAQWRKAMIAEGAPDSHYTNAFPNSDYLRILCEGGFIALALFLGLGATFMHRAWKIRELHPQALATLAALAVVCAADAALVRPESAMAVGVILAALVTAQTETNLRSDAANSAAGRTSSQVDWSCNKDLS
jgi:O-antigen ligase